MARSRLRVPLDLSADLLFQADHTCCKCQKREPDVQVHHINPRKGNHANNLIPVCLNCHSEFHRRGGLGKKFGEQEIKRYREEWFTAVRKRRARAEQEKGKSDLEALARFEVRRLCYDLEALRDDDDKTRGKLIQLFPYARDFGFEIRQEILQAVDYLADWIRSGRISESTVGVMSSLAMECLPLGMGSLVAPRTREIRPEEKAVLHLAVLVAFGIMYEAAKYARSEGMFKTGCELMYMVLRFAVLNRLKDEEELALGEIARLDNFGAPWKTTIEEFRTLAYSRT